MKPKYLFIATLVLALYLASRSARVVTGYAVGPDLPRGIRNNNPGNIRISGSAWQGKKPLSENTDKTYEQFYDSRHGLRAIVKVLTKYTEYGIATMSGVANRWAPSFENDSAAYAKGLSKSTGVGVDERVNLTNPTIMLGLVRGIVKNENGTNLGIGWYSDALIMDVVKQTQAGG